jgi:predicted DNA-binding antitoxin AbrB/MazE fold protein
MTQTVTATYSGGVLRPATPLPLAEGQTVEITVTSSPPPAPAVTEGEAIRRIREAKSLEELWAAIDAAPEDELPAGYDFFEALNENRRLAGDVRMLYPPEMKGITW